MNTRFLPLEKNVPVQRHRHTGPSTKPRSGNVHNIVMKYYFYKFIKTIRTVDPSAVAVATIFLEHLSSNSGMPTKRLINSGLLFKSKLYALILTNLGSKCRKDR